MSHSRALILTSTVLLLAAAGCKPKPEETGNEATPEPAEVQNVEPPQEATAGDRMVAAATLKTADGTEVGTVTFTQRAGGTEMVADLHDVKGVGAHGIHVHETGECSAPDFKSAGGHFNPQGADHACPPTTPRHAGDFGNVDVSQDGSGHLDETSDLVTVTPGNTSVVGKAMILHAGKDDCTSQPSGDAGPRLACGVITLSGDEGMDEEMVQPDEAAQEASQEGPGGT